MKKTILITAFLISFLGMAQDQYEKGMRKASQLWTEGNTTEASNLYERIATAELDNWLPYYYVSSINTIVSFGEKDKEKLTQQLEKAQEFIDLAKSIAPENAEIMVQQAMIYTAWIASDGANYGMTLSPKVVALYQKAEQLAPDNPRVVFSKAEWDIGSAQYFGQDIKPYCKDIERSLELFDAYEPESELHPDWGRERAEAALQNCDK